MNGTTTPFDTIESAQEYVKLLAEAVSESKKELESDVAKELKADVPRRLQVLRLALYDLEKLQSHMSTTNRLLDELRSLHPLVAGKGNGSHTHA